MLRALSLIAEGRPDPTHVPPTITSRFDATSVPTSALKKTQIPNSVIDNYRASVEPRHWPGLNVTSVEILYGNVLIFDFCCISRCSGGNSPDGGLLFANLADKFSFKMCFSALIHVICSRFTTFLPYPLPSDPVPRGSNLTMIQPYVANMSRGQHVCCRQVCVD